VKIPVMAKVRIGHFVEAQILEAIGVDFVDESEVLTPADELHHIDKRKFRVPFVCGARGLDEALRRISEGALMIRTKGEPGTGDIVQAVTHMRQIAGEIREAVSLREDELFVMARDLAVPIDLLLYVHEHGKLPVPNFSAGGIATPADAALMRQLGAEGVFVGSAFSSQEIPSSARRRLSKRASTTMIPIVWRISRRISERRWSGLNPKKLKLSCRSASFKTPPMFYFSLYTWYSDEKRNVSLMVIPQSFSLFAVIPT